MVSLVTNLRFLEVKRIFQTLVLMGCDFGCCDLRFRKTLCRSNDDGPSCNSGRCCWESFARSTAPTAWLRTIGGTSSSQPYTSCSVCGSGCCCCTRPVDDEDDAKAGTVAHRRNVNSSTSTSDPQRAHILLFMALKSTCANNVVLYVTRGRDLGLPLCNDTIHILAQ